MKILKMYKDPVDNLVYFFDCKNRTLIEIEYDENAPCKICGLPVGNASMGGTNICPACDMGKFRNGERWTFETMPKKYPSNEFMELAKEKSIGDLGEDKNTKYHSSWYDKHL